MTCGEIRAALRAGCAGPNQVKAFLRCGMGPCQGRMCGMTLTSLAASTHDISMGGCRFPNDPSAAPSDIPRRSRGSCRTVTDGRTACHRLSYSLNFC
ncbi:(2Fe-2S)-binding protein (plasmid) [Sinorhizobium meliloti]|nr:(2Fe-2S)-binding protein [Sinorhizobium meliloti]